MRTRPLCKAILALLLAAGHLTSLANEGGAVPRHQAWAPRPQELGEAGLLVEGLVPDALSQSEAIRLDESVPWAGSQRLILASDGQALIADYGMSDVDTYRVVFHLVPVGTSDTNAISRISFLTVTSRLAENGFVSIVANDNEGNLLDSGDFSSGDFVSAENCDAACLRASGAAGLTAGIGCGALLIAGGVIGGFPGALSAVICGLLSLGVSSASYATCLNSALNGCQQIAPLIEINVYCAPNAYTQCQALGRVISYRSASQMDLYVQWHRSDFDFAISTHKITLRLENRAGPNYLYSFDRIFSSGPVCFIQNTHYLRGIASLYTGSVHFAMSKPSRPACPPY